MKRFLVFVMLLALAHEVEAQVIKRGRGKPVYARVEDTAAMKPFELTKYDMVQLNVFDLIFTDVSVSYEHFSPDGMKGYQLPVSFNAGGLPDTSDYMRNGRSPAFLASRNRIFQTGFNYNYYLNGQDKVSLYMGAGFNLGWFAYWRYEYDTIPSGWGSGYMIVYKSSDRKIGNNYAGLIHGGVLINPRETVILNLKAGFGLRRYGTEFREYTTGYFTLDIALGFKF